MSLSDNFIKRPVLTTVCSILIVLMGIIAIPSLSIENLPNIAPPLIQVTANYGGANSVVTEQAVTNPLEQQITVSRERPISLQPARIRVRASFRFISTKTRISTSTR